MARDGMADTSLLIVLFLFATVALRLALVLFVVWLLIPRRRLCPHCGQPTATLEAPVARIVGLERRWCLECGWSGVAKRLPALAARSSQPSIPAAGVLMLWAGMAAGCAAPRDPVRDLFDDDAAWVDLTHPFDQQTIYWPTAQPFALAKVADGTTPGGYYYAANNFSAAEHGGTHLDAPVHFAAGKHTTDAIPLGRLVGPAAVVDVQQQATRDPDYRVTVADLEAFEASHGPIPDGAILLVRTGWSSRWPDRQAYLGTAETGPAAVSRLHFPGIDSTAARWLVDRRRIGAVGIDTPSIDFGQSSSFDTHRILFAVDIPAFENLAALHLLPATGAFVVALPMKIAGGSGGPLRVVGVLPHRP